jgi:hypothetical protein
MIAIVLESECEYQVFHLSPKCRSGGRDINWMEAIAFELLASELLSRGYTGRVLVNTDSTAALNIFAGKGSSSKHLKQVGLRLRSQIPSWPFSMRAQWVKSGENIADAFSRGRIRKGYKRSECLAEIPRELRDFVSYKQLL